MSFPFELLLYNVCSGQQGAEIIFVTGMSRDSPSKSKVRGSTLELCLWIAGLLSYNLEELSILLNGFGHTRVIPRSRTNF